MSSIKDYTWPVCRNCRHRVKVEAHVHKYTLGIYTGEQVEEAYICNLGLDRNRSPNFCPLKEEMK